MLDCSIPVVFRGVRLGRVINWLKLHLMASDSTIVRVQPRQLNSVCFGFHTNDRHLSRGAQFYDYSRFV